LRRPCSAPSGRRLSDRPDYRIVSQVQGATALLRQTAGEQLLAPKRAPYLLLLYITKVLSQLLIPALLGVSDVLVISLGALQRMVQDTDDVVDIVRDTCVRPGHDEVLLAAAATIVCPAKKPALIHVNRSRFYRGIQDEHRRYLEDRWLRARGAAALRHRCARGSAGQIQQHIFHVRLDVTIDGENNRVAPGRIEA
jgi:hypothetical protein